MFMQKEKKNQIDLSCVLERVVMETNVNVNIHEFKGGTNINNISGHLNIFLDKFSSDEDKLVDIIVGLINLINFNSDSEEKEVK